MSETAADALSDRGLSAWSLVGGMKAWSLAWNTARVAVSGTHADVTQIRRTGKGCLSYLIASKGEAVVIDPSLPPDVYLQYAAQSNARIAHVLDTHIHADHLSRARQLAEMTGATLHLPDQQRVSFAFEPLSHGDRVRFGDASLAVVGTPGHTLESVSFVLDEVAVFTGDTLFVNGVGRPDLKADADSARERARLLYRSLRSIRDMKPETVVLPGHANQPVPFDGQAIASTLRGAARWLDEWLSSPSDFVERLVTRLPDTPPNFVRIVELNERGQFPGGDATDLEAGANRCAVS
jgi:glyoxylase-like metal-dependent hydrolase (beta-lactamase superfamily II)